MQRSALKATPWMSETYTVAYCPNCDDVGPVLVSEFPIEDDGMLPKQQDVTVVYCTGCDSIINALEKVEVKYLTVEELEKLGWTVLEKNLNSLDNPPKVV